MQSIEKIDWYADYIVQWRPLDMCNYDCSYCSPSNHKTIVKQDITSADRLIQAANNIRNSVPIDKRVLVYVTGGEPFLVNEVDRWFNHMALECGFKVVVFTNGSMPIKTFMKCKDSFENISVKLSFHPENADLDHFVELASTIVANGGTVEIRAMLANKLFDRVDELEKRLHNYNIPVIRLPVFPLVDPATKHVNPTFSSSRLLKHYQQTIDDGSLGYFSEDEIRIIRDAKQATPEYLSVMVDGVETNASTIVRNSQNKFKGWQCGITNKKILIQANGNVQYGVCKNTGTIGNIFDNINLFTDEFTICQQAECHTIDEVMVTKFRG